MLPSSLPEEGKGGEGEGRGRGREGEGQEDEDRNNGGIETVGTLLHMYVWYVSDFHTNHCHSMHA